MTNSLNKDKATGVIAKFFSTTDKTTVPVDEVFKIYNRDLNDEKANKQWLSNVLWSIKDFGLVVRHYTKRDGSRVISRLSLTEAGKEALNRSTQLALEADVIIPAQAEAVVTTEELLESVNRDVDKLRRKLPSFEVIFDVKPKGVLR